MQVVQHLLALSSVVNNISANAGKSPPSRFPAFSLTTLASPSHTLSHPCLPHQRPSGAACRGALSYTHSTDRYCAPQERCCCLRMCSRP